MNHLLEVTDYTKQIEGFADKLAFGGQMVLIGVSVVFAVLILLWFSLYIFKIFFHDIPSKRKANHKPVKTAESASTPVTAKQTDEDEIIAVIAAAIAAAECENPGLKFRVVSFRRK